MTTSGTNDLKANAGRGTGAAVVGAVMGLVPVTVSDYLRFQLLADEPDPTLFLAGHFALTLVYASPYLLVLMASKVKKTNTRGGLRGSRSSLICSMLLPHVADPFSSSTCDVSDLVRRGQEPYRLDSPAGDHHGRRRFGNGGRCNGRPGFLCTIRSPLCTLRTRSGGAMLVGFFEPRWTVCEVWRHTTLLRERLHLERRGRYERRHSGDCLPGHASGHKAPTDTRA